MVFCWHSGELITCQVLDAGVRRSVSLRTVPSLGLEKLLQDCPALLVKEPTGYLNTMVEAAFCRNVDNRSAGSGFRVPGAEYQAGNTGLHHRPGAHGAGFKRDVKRRVSESPCLQLFSSLPDHDHFCMGRRVLRNLPVVMTSCDDFVAVHEHGADGDLSNLRRMFSLLESQFHVVDIIQLLFHRGRYHGGLDCHRAC